jgi:hypothetical protein
VGFLSVLASSHAPCTWSSPSSAIAASDPGDVTPSVCLMPSVQPLDAIEPRPWGLALGAPTVSIGHRPLVIWPSRLSRQTEPAVVVPGHPYFRVDTPWRRRCARGTDCGHLNAKSQNSSHASLLSLQEETGSLAARFQAICLGFAASAANESSSRRERGQRAAGRIALNKIGQGLLIRGERAS